MSDEEPIYMDAAELGMRLDELRRRMPPSDDLEEYARLFTALVVHLGEACKTWRLRYEGIAKTQTMPTVTTIPMAKPPGGKLS